MQDYNFTIVHIPRKSNGPADTLSRPVGMDTEPAPKEVSLIAPDAFLNLAQPGDGSVEEDIVHSQVRWVKELQSLVDKWLI